MDILILALTLVFIVIAGVSVFLIKKGILNVNKVAIITAAYFNLVLYIIFFLESLSFTSIQQIPHPVWIFLFSYTVIIWIVIYPFTKWALNDMFGKKLK
jgi:hypothetical protein